MQRQSGVLLFEELLLAFLPQSDLLPVVYLLRHRRSLWFRWVVQEGYRPGATLDPEHILILTIFF